MEAQVLLSMEAQALLNKTFKQVSAERINHLNLKNWVILLLGDFGLQSQLYSCAYAHRLGGRWWWWW